MVKNHYFILKFYCIDIFLFIIFLFRLFYILQEFFQENSVEKLGIQRKFKFTLILGYEICLRFFSSKKNPV